MNIQRTILYTFLTTIIFLIGVTSAQASSEIYLSPSILEPRINEVFEVELFMRADDEPVNALSAEISYNTDILELISYRRTSEKVSFWIENDVDPRDGNILIEGLLINQGWQGRSEKLARLTFRVKGPGSTEIGIDKGALHAYDGTGVNILDTVTHAVINIKSGEPRKEYVYIASGNPDVNETLTPDILYDDDYSREYNIIYVMPWWAWVLFVLTLVLFILSYRLWRKLHFHVKNLEE